METGLRLGPVVVNWRRKVSSAGALFVCIETVKAVYDRCAVVEDSEKNITVEFPRSKGEGARMVWMIRRDVVPRREVLSMREYVD